GGRPPARGNPGHPASSRPRPSWDCPGIVRCPGDGRSHRVEANDGVQLEGSSARQVGHHGPPRSPVVTWVPEPDSGKFDSSPGATFPPVILSPRRPSRPVPAQTNTAIPIEPSMITHTSGELLYFRTMSPS